LKEIGEYAPTTCKADEAKMTALMVQVNTLNPFMTERVAGWRAPHFFVPFLASVVVSGCQSRFFLIHTLILQERNETNYLQR
jgi:hypothetical protein